MILVWSLGGVLVGLLLLAVGLLIYKELQIKKPTRTIIMGIRNGKFSAHETEDGYTITTEHGNTKFIYYAYIDAWSVIGEFSWMNVVEAERTGRVVKEIIKGRMEKYHAACKIEKQARDDKARAEAIERYKE